MSKFTFKLSILALLGFLLFKGAVWYLTDGFSVKEYYTENASPSSPPSSTVIILSQPFKYLNKGSQSAIFISEDGQWVLKILRQNRLTPTYFIRFLSKLKKHEGSSKIENNCHIHNGLVKTIITPFSELMKKTQTEVERKKNKRTQLYTSCRIAFTRLSKETELHYLSLEGTKIHLDVKDKLDRPHKIDLSKCAFSIQKKATLPYPTLIYYMQQKEEEKAKKCLDSIVKVFKDRLHKGIADDDPSVKKNIGFIETRALFLDIGGFYESKECKDPIIQRHQILIALLELKQWLHEYYPSLEEHLDSVSTHI